MMIRTKKLKTSYLGMNQIHTTRKKVQPPKAGDFPEEIFCLYLLT